MSNVQLPPSPFTRAEVAGDRPGDRKLYALEERGVIKRIVHGVYVHRDEPDSLELRVACLERVVSEHQIVADRTAAWMHGVDAYAFGEIHDVPPVEVCARRGHPSTDRAGVAGRTRDLRDSDIMTIRGMRVTTPTRTALDLGCHLHRRYAFGAMCMLAREHGLTAPGLTRELPRFKGRRGVRQLRTLVGLISGGFESHREAWTFLAIHDDGLPLPELQVWVTEGGVKRYRLDLAYPKLRVCVEYDGYEAHERDPDQREHDQKRRRWLRDRGWTIIVVRNGDFTGRALERWLNELQQALTPFSSRRW